MLLYGVVVDDLYLAFLSITHSVIASISHTVLNSTSAPKKRYGDLRLNVEHYKNLTSVSGFSKYVNVGYRSEYNWNTHIFWRM